MECIFERMVGSRQLLTLLLGILLSYEGSTQDTLPSFSLYKLGPDKVLIQWSNPDAALRQISIQQSADSLFRFKTIITIPDPRLPVNGTVINRPGAGTMYYRIYLLYPKGKYQFSSSRLPALPPPTPNPSPKPNSNKPNPISDNIPDTVSRIRPLIGELPDLVPGQKIDLKKVSRKKSEPDRVLPSKHVYAHRDGYAFIEIPAEWDLTQIEIRFFSENGQPLFDLKSPAIRTFRVDKSNFYRAGWQEFEIWLKGKLMERNRFYLPLEF